MSDIGFNDNLEVGGRKFHFQTATITGKGKIRCEIFESGRVLSSTEVDFDRRKGERSDAVEERLREVVESLHDEMISEVELLFKIADKVAKLKHSPSNVKVGILFLQNNMIDDAIKQFKKAIEFDPGYADAYNNLAMTYMKIGNFKDAIKTYEEVINRNGQYTDTFNNYGLALLMDERIADAQEQFKHALRLNRDYLEAHYNMALMYLKSTIDPSEQLKSPPRSVRIQRAVEHLEKIKSHEIKVFNVLLGKLNKNLNNNKIKEAVQTLEENRSKVFPTNVSNLISTNFYLKFMYGGKGLDGETIKRFEHRLHLALEDNPDYADIWNNLGVIHLIQCRNLFLQALTEFNKALDLNPDFEKAIKNKKLVENDGKEFLILLRAILK
jgi:tetratricopeptide (TPR) repeat protein